MERSPAPILLICAALLAAPPAARGEAAGAAPVLLAAAEAEDPAGEVDTKAEEDRRKEEEKKKKEEARKAEEARKRAEKEKREAEKKLKKAREEGKDQEGQEEPASSAAKSQTAPAQPLQKSFTISPKSAQQPAAGAVPMKIAPGAVAPSAAKGTVAPKGAAGAVAPKALSPPVSRGGAPVYTAPLAPTTTYSRDELDQPGVPGFGLAPTGGPSSGLSGPGGTAGPLEGAISRPDGPKLPPGTLHLLVNGEFGETHLSPNQSVTASWDVSPATNTSGIALFVTDNPGETCKDRADANDLFPPASYHAGFPTGSTAVSLGGQPLGSNLYFLGCAADPDSEGKIKYRKQDTNVVKARYAGAPDLVVSSLEMVSDEIRFKIKNLGDAEKPPGEIDYVVGLTYAGADGRSFTRGFGGTAGITSLSRLAPGEETAEDRVTEQRDMKFDGVQKFQLCINPGNKIPESDRSNNCVERSSGEVLPDLTIVEGRIELAKPPKDKGFWDWAKDIGRCAGPQYIVSQAFGHCNYEFDPGLENNAVFVTVRNEGGIPVSRGDVRIDLQYGGKAIEGGGIVPLGKPVGPGEQTVVRKNLGPARHWQYDDEACCTAVATADPNGKILESNENNNEFNVTEVQR